MRRVLVSGVLLAFLAALAIWIGTLFDISMGSTLFGVAIGAVLALVPGFTPVTKIIGFIVGFIVTFAMYAVQALFLPLSTIGSVVGAFITVIILTIIAALVHRKLPFWSMLLGAAGIAGAYGAQFLAAPQNLAIEGVAAAGSGLFLAALGFLGTSIAELVPSSEDEDVPAISKSPTPDDNAGADILSSTKG